MTMNRTAIKARLQHLFNPLHVYCRLVGLRVNRKMARKLVGYYELAYVKVL
jgi:hypothetical protein